MEGGRGLSGLELSLTNLPETQPAALHTQKRSNRAARSMAPAAVRLKSVTTHVYTSVRLSVTTHVYTSVCTTTNFF